jgi:gliding motility-associated-like protein
MKKQILLCLFCALCFCTYTNYAANKIQAKNYNYTLTTSPHDSLIVVAPNIFTPNGDGVNDFWSIVVHDYGVAIIDLQTTVYDRWGKEIFMSTNLRQVWNGHNLIGKPCEDGVYYYIVSFTNGVTLKTEVLKGFIQLSR